MKPALRFLLALVPILSCTTIARVAVLETQWGIGFEKARALEAESHSPAVFNAAKKSLMDQMSTDEAAKYRKYWEKHAPEASKPYDMYPLATQKTGD
jgi:hypothetical protein